jgi:hypothetical protein
VKQGSPLSTVNGHQADEFDLDAELAAIDLSPQPLKFAGATYLVRRDLTGQEVAEFWRLLRSPSDADDESALAILVGEDAVALNTALTKLPQPRMQRAVQVILQKAGLTTTTGDSGESKAS